MALEAVIEALGGGKAARQGTPPSWAQINAEQAQAQPGRDRIAANMRSAEAAIGGDPASQPSVGESQWRAMVFGSPDGGNDLDAAIGALSGSEQPKKDPKWVPEQAAPVAPEAPKVSATATPGKPVGWVDKYVEGPLQAGLSVASSVLATPIAAAGGLVRGLTGGKYGTAEGAKEAQARAAEILQSLTYQPRNEAGANALQTFSNAFEASKLGGMGPSESIALGNAVANIPKGGIEQGVRLALGADKGAPAAEVAAPAAAGAPKGAMGSVGAAGVEPTQAAKALAEQAKTPEMKQVIERAAPKMTAEGLKTAERHIEADTLPVPVKLTAGQATQDVGLLSTEQNARGMKEAIRNRFAEQNKQLTENLDAIRDMAAPDVYATSKPSMGEALIDAYKTKDAAINKVISENYKALKDANGGAFPMDAKAFVSAADDALHKQLKFEFVPGPLERQLQAFRDGAPMNFEQFEAMRTNLANIMRSQADGNVKQAAAIIRNALEDLPMPAGAEHLKPLADAARASARERFALIEADPAYKAVVRGKASADRFVDKFVLDADTAAVAKMKENLSHDPVAVQTMAAGAMRRLKDRAGILGDQGNFSQAGYNKALEGLSPKLGIIFQPESKKLVEQLGNVARYVKGQPTGSFVNNSGTAVAAAAMLSDAAKSGIEGAVNVAAHGVPIATWARKVSGFVKEQKALSQSLQTGAGLRLKDIR